MRTDFARGHRPMAAEALASFAALEMERRSYSDHTRHAYRIAVQAYLDRSGLAASSRVDQLDLASVERFERDLERRAMRATTRHIKIAAVKAFVAYLERQELLSVPFSRDIVVPSVERTRPRATNPEHICALAQLAQRTPRDAALVALLLRSGIRLSELVKLTLDDLTLPARARRVTSRSTSRGRRWRACGRGGGILTCSGGHPGGSPSVSPARLRIGARRNGQREILLDATTTERLTAYLAVRPSTEHRQLFVTKSGVPLTFAGTSSLVRMYAREAGTPGVSARSLRAAYIANQLEAGRSIAQVQPLVGHGDHPPDRRYAGGPPLGRAPPLPGASPSASPQRTP